MSIAVCALILKFCVSLIITYLSFIAWRFLLMTEKVTIGIAESNVSFIVVLIVSITQNYTGMSEKCLKW